MLRTAFDHELSEVEQALVQMHRDVDQALGRALRAYEYAQRHSAESLIAADGAINERRAGVEEAVLRLIARRQSMARELRLGMAAVAVAGGRICTNETGVFYGDGWYDMGVASLD